jgi:alanine racemase
MSAKRSSVRQGRRGDLQPNGMRTWIEIDSRAARKNYDVFRKLTARRAGGKRTKLWAVVKSNAYGHGLFAFSKIMNRFGIDGFCVDSLVEGIALRKDGIKKPILVLGHTLPARYPEAVKHNITITVSSFEALRELANAKEKVKTVPEFHIKIDTGMHRQGFYLEDLPRVIKVVSSKKEIKSRLTGLYTHFASAKDINYPSYTDHQFGKFQKAAKLFEKAGFKNLIKHAAATGGTLIGTKYHLDAVRVGIGLYGLWPSKELEVQLGRKIKLHPILSWRAVVSEVKPLKAGDYVGYDMAERVANDTMMAVLPIGYWHGFPRMLSSGAGEAIVNGRRARVLGRVSMDVTAIAPGGRVHPGDIATLIGRDGGEEIFAWEPAQKSGTVHYEFLTRLNPLMERVVR